MRMRLRWEALVYRRDASARSGRERFSSFPELRLGSHLVLVLALIPDMLSRSVPLCVSCTSWDGYSTVVSMIVSCLLNLLTWI